MIVGKVWGRQQLCSLTLCRTTNITQHQRAALSVPKWKYVHLFSTVCVREAVIVLVAGRSDSHLGSKALLVALSNAAAFVQRRAQSTLTAVISFALHCAPNITLLYSSSIQNIPCQRKMRSIYNALRQSGWFWEDSLVWFNWNQALRPDFNGPAKLIDQNWFSRSGSLKPNI